MYDRYIEYLQNRLDEASAHYDMAIHAIDAGDSIDDWYESETYYDTFEEFKEGSE
jgi:hypothetical protein